MAGEEERALADLTLHGLCRFWGRRLRRHVSVLRLP